MNKGTLIVIAVVLVIAIVGIGLALLWFPGEEVTNTTTNRTTNTDVTNEAPFVNAPLRADEQTQIVNVEESTTLDTITYRDAPIPIQKAQLQDVLPSSQLRADTGFKFVVVYLESTGLTQDAPLTWLSEESLLIDGDGNNYNSVAQRIFADKNVESFLAFQVPDDVSDFTLRFTRPEEDVEVSLGF